MEDKASLFSTLPLLTPLSLQMCTNYADFAFVVIFFSFVFLNEAL